MREKKVPHRGLLLRNRLAIPNQTAMKRYLYDNNRVVGVADDPYGVSEAS